MKTFINFTQQCHRNGTRDANWWTHRYTRVHRMCLSNNLALSASANFRLCNLWTPGKRKNPLWYYAIVRGGGVRLWCRTNANTLFMFEAQIGVQNNWQIIHRRHPFTAMYFCSSNNLPITYCVFMSKFARFIKK